jgi:hypothetical protein
VETWCTKSTLDKRSEHQSYYVMYIGILQWTELYAHEEIQNHWKLGAHNWWKRDQCILRLVRLFYIPRPHDMLCLHIWALIPSEIILKFPQKLCLNLIGYLDSVVHLLFLCVSIVSYFYSKVRDILRNISMFPLASYGLVRRNTSWSI